jgi:hypothetical protein
MTNEYLYCGVSVILIVVALFGSLFLLGYVASPSGSVTKIGVLENVKVDDMQVILTLDTGVVEFRLSRNDILQTPLEIGSKYQIDLNFYNRFPLTDGYYELRSITKLGDI